MSVADHEIPDSERSRDDKLEIRPEDITPTNRPFYLMLVGGLLIALLFGLVAWFILALRGSDMPEGMAVLVASIGGGVVGLLTASTSRK